MAKKQVIRALFRVTRMVIPIIKEWGKVAMKKVKGFFVEAFKASCSVLGRFCRRLFIEVSQKVWGEVWGKVLAEDVRETIRGKLMKWREAFEKWRQEREEEEEEKEKERFEEEEEKKERFEEEEKEKEEEKKEGEEEEKKETEEEEEEEEEVEVEVEGEEEEEEVEGEGEEEENKWRKLDQVMVEICDGGDPFTWGV